MVLGEIEMVAEGESRIDGATVFYLTLVGAQCTNSGSFNPNREPLSRFHLPTEPTCQPGTRPKMLRQLLSLLLQSIPLGILLVLLGPSSPADLIDKRL